MLLRLAMSRRRLRRRVMLASGSVRFAKLLGAMRTVEFMALAGNATHENGHNKD